VLRLEAHAEVDDLDLKGLLASFLDFPDQKVFFWFRKGK